MKFSESHVEDATLEWFSGLGYAVLHGPDISPDGPTPERVSYDQVLLTERLGKRSSASTRTCPPRHWRKCCARCSRPRPPRSSRRTGACTAT